MGNSSRYCDLAACAHICSKKDFLFFKLFNGYNGNGSFKAEYNFPYKHHNFSVETGLSTIQDKYNSYQKHTAFTYQIPHTPLFVSLQHTLRVNQFSMYSSQDFLFNDIGGSNKTSMVLALNKSLRNLKIISNAGISYVNHTGFYDFLLNTSARIIYKTDLIKKRVQMVNDISGSMVSSLLDKRISINDRVFHSREYGFESLGNSDIQNNRNVDVPLGKYRIGSDPGAKFTTSFTNKINLINIPLLRDISCGLFLLNRYTLYPPIYEKFSLEKSIRGTHGIGLSFDGIPNVSIMLYYILHTTSFNSGDIPRNGIGFNIDLN